MAQAIFKKNTLFLASSAFLIFITVAFYAFIITKIAYLLKKSLKQYRLLFRLYSHSTNEDKSSNFLHCRTPSKDRSVMLIRYSSFSQASCEKSDSTDAIFGK